MNLKQLEYFVRVAEFGSFSKAALVLRVAQPVLSRQVRALETELRATLLLRNGRGVCLTDAGNRLFEHSVSILQMVSQAREEVALQRGQLHGRIVIGLPPSISRQLTLPLVDVFERKLPQARLAIVEGLSAHIAEWIASGRVDVGLVHNPHPQAAIETTPIFEESLCLVSSAPKGVRAEPNAQPVRTAELPHYRLIVPERTHVIRNLVETQAALSGIKLNIAWEISSIPSIIDLVCAGYGGALLPASAIEASGRAAELHARALIDPELKSTVCLALSSNKRPSTLTQHVLRMLPDLVLKASCAKKSSACHTNSV